MNNNLKIITLIFLSLMFIGLASASTIGNYGLKQCVNLIQTCGNCTYVNITSVSAVTNDGASIKLLSEVPMTKNGVEYNYTFCDTSFIGEYTYITVGDPDGIIVTQPVIFNVGNNSYVLIIILFVLVYVIGFVGFFGKNIWVSILGGLAMIALGIFTITNGIDIYRNFITAVIAWTTIGIGAIFALIASIELIEENL